MQLSERQVNGVLIIDVAGDLTVDEIAGAVRDKVTAALKRGERRIVLNVGKLEHVDSSCLGEIVTSYKLVASYGGMLKLEQVSPQLRSVLRTTTLDTLLESYDTEEAAIASFGKPADAPATLSALVGTEVASPDAPTIYIVRR
jgi:anti-sigma B factor antagonist